MVSTRSGVTVRYLHKLFESEGVTYSEFVLRERLARAYHNFPPFTAGDQHNRFRPRVQRPVVLQQGVSPALQRDAIRD
jgi:hypothetical protein